MDRETADSGWDDQCAQRMLRLLGLARRAGKLILGEPSVYAACRRKTARLVLLAEDTAAGTAQKVRHRAQTSGITCKILPFDKRRLGTAFGREVSAVMALTDEEFAKTVRQTAEDRQ